MFSHNPHKIRPALLGTIVTMSAIMGLVPLTAIACSTYYVATNGNDGNVGSLTKPWQHIATGGYRIKACDTLYVRGGVYNEDLVILNQLSTAAQPTRVWAYNGEAPILDASNIAYGLYDPFFLLNGQNIIVSGFEVRNGGTGIYLQGNNDTVSNMKVHHVLGTGILAKGDYSVVQNSTVYQTCLDHYNYLIGNGGHSGWGTGISAARNPVTGITRHAQLTGNTVYNVWGEGLSTYEADGTLISNNTVYDNWAENTYISDASNVLFKDNLVYNTANNVVGKRANLLSLADEVASVPRSTNNVVINNMFLNGNLDAFSWTIVPGSGLSNAFITNNTLVNGTLNTGNINQASVVENNIFFRNDGGAVAAVPTLSGLQFTNNIWSSKPAFIDPNDWITNPQLALTGTITAGTLSKTYFAISATSPAISDGQPVLVTVSNYTVSSQATNLNVGAYITDPIKYTAS